MLRRAPRSTLCPYTTLCRSRDRRGRLLDDRGLAVVAAGARDAVVVRVTRVAGDRAEEPASYLHAQDHLVRPPRLGNTGLGADLGPLPPARALRLDLLTPHSY